MAKEIVITDDQKEELEAFRSSLGVHDKERFYKAVKFCHLQLDGKNRNASYSEAFGIPLEEARKFSSSFHRAKWVQELFRFLRPDDNTLYHGEFKAIVQQGMKIINDDSASNRDKVEAMKALNPYIKQAEAKIDVNHTGIESTQTQIMVAGLMEGISKITEIGKMISKEGEIIDVPVLE